MIGNNRPAALQRACFVFSKTNDFSSWPLLGLHCLSEVSCFLHLKERYNPEWELQVWKGYKTPSHNIVA